MAPNWSCWVTVLAAALLLCVVPVCSQTVVDDEICETYNIECPEDSDPYASYKTYCCAESNGGEQLYYCCNPYLGLYIGIGVGIPVIILVIVIVVVIYCMCVRHQNRKMRTLLDTYNARRQRERENRENEESSFVAPPPYTPLEGSEQRTDTEQDPDLPAYTENDPYAPTPREQVTTEVVIEVTGVGESSSEDGTLVSDEAPLITDQAES